MSNPTSAADLPVSQPSGATSAAFRACFDESLEQVLDLDTWHPGVDLVREYANVSAQIAAAVEAETESHPPSAPTSSRN